MRTPHQPRWDRAVSLGLLNASEVAFLEAGYAYRNMDAANLDALDAAVNGILGAADALTTDTPAAAEPTLPERWRVNKDGDLAGPGWFVLMTPIAGYAASGPEALVIEDTMGGPGAIPWEVIRWVEWKIAAKAAESEE